MAKQKISKRQQLAAISKKPYKSLTKKERALYEARKAENRKKGGINKQVRKAKESGRYGNVRDSTLRNIVKMIDAYPEIGALSIENQKNIEYAFTDIIGKSRLKTKKGKRLLSLIIKKDEAKERGDDPGTWITEDEVTEVNDILELWDIPEDAYTAVYGSDPA